MVSQRALVGLVLAASATGCVFLVEPLPDGLTSTCKFSSDAGTACEACILQYCQKQLDSCCADDACKAALSSADKCATEDECADFAAAGDAGTTGDLLGCVSGACRSACFGDAGARDGSTCAGCMTDCALPNDVGCGCKAASAAYPANANDCSSGDVENGLCCESSGYPTAASSTCSCVRVYCNDDGQGTCTCAIGSQVVGSGTDVSECFPSTGTCCLTSSTGDCICGDVACDASGEVAVSHCGVDTITCPTDSAETLATSTCTRSN